MAASNRSADSTVELRIAAAIQGSSPCCNAKRTSASLASAESLSPSDNASCRRTRGCGSSTICNTAESSSGCRSSRPFRQPQCVDSHGKVRILQPALQHVGGECIESAERVQRVQARLRRRPRADQVLQRWDNRCILPFDHQPLGRHPLPVVGVRKIRHQLGRRRFDEIERFCRRCVVRHDAPDAAFVAPAISDRMYSCCKYRGMAE